MRYPSSTSTRGLVQLRLSSRSLNLRPGQPRRTLFTSNRANAAKQVRSPVSTIPLAVLSAGGLLLWSLHHPNQDLYRLSGVPLKQPRPEQGDADDGQPKRDAKDDGDRDESHGDGSRDDGPFPAWANFARTFETASLTTALEWSTLSDKLAGYILPDWAKLMPGYIGKLQRELSMSPGSLADEIWHEAHDPLVNPEIRYSASVRVSDELCDDEKEYLSRRKRVIRVALARYLDLREDDIHPDDVPTIAMCGSGGGLRALIAGAGSILATEEDGLFDCVTYTAGVSGSCWLQAFNLSSLAKGRVATLVEHLKSRASTHIAYPPVALQSLVSLPTSKYLLSGIVEKLRGDPNADFGLVDVYGLLLAARYLVPKGDLGVNERDFKFSNQRDYIKYGQSPMPIYTAVRHEIPGLNPDGTADMTAEQAKEQAKNESWFQWFELTPYEFFCEEFGAGIPTWALGRKFQDGEDVPPPPENKGFHMPEIRVPLLLGVFGSAFCATLNHYYREIRPVVSNMTGFGTVDEMITGKSSDLSKVHPIDPARIPNFAYRMHGKLPKTTPASVYDQEYIQLMDAGMSNNLPVYPLLRPGRNVDVMITFDNSADVRTDNWLSVVDGYARQRGIKGWPLGIGWPKPDESATQTQTDLAEAQGQVHTAQEADWKIREAKSQAAAAGTASQDLGYCTIWVGKTEERTSEPPPPPKAIGPPDAWRLMEADAGIAVVYLPLLPNDKVPNVSPGETDFLSTWNFVYTPEQIDKVVQLARANYDEGKDQIRETVRAVYERKKATRLEAEKQDRMKRLARRGEKALAGEGDQFS
ncbi:cytosolic phospholipase A2 [Geosmithia morbida]|uniref:Lysophospholipase n=1 Tax=Geosmithia morbida TaxID=1094350 RepID=A0A9P5D6Z3_9HYPO|nr:cytosolic phospholipase A2 [Geosmithia morbida]KAF4125270.1 cytosolic phospholipase A2 [Geosmithia morbida]